MLKTILPESINSLAEAKIYMKALYDNGEEYHCEDTVEPDYFGGITKKQCKHMNNLMDQIYALAHDTAFDPCGYLNSLCTEQVAENARELGSHLMPGKFYLTGSAAIFEGYHYESYLDLIYPFFTKDVAELVVEHCKGHFRWTDVTWDEDNIRIDCREHEKHHLVFITPTGALIDGTMITLYDIQQMDIKWDWNVVK